MTTALAMGIDVLFVLGLLGVFMSVNRLFGPKGVHAGDGALPYETGMPPIERAQDNMAVLYWRFAVLFVVFDVDLAFVLPWALNRPGFDLGQAAAMTVFIFLMLLMLAYFWRRGVLECEI
jgi:NADH-quinone oxidoreductase subunit A